MMKKSANETPSFMLMILTLMAKMTETPVMWFGMSVGPFRTDYGHSLMAAL